MIIDFSVRNYRSFRDEQRISFVASNQYKDLPGNLIDPRLEGRGFRDLRLLKGLAVYGANAAGKTNALHALRYLGQFVERSATGLNEGDPTGVTPFALDPAALDAPSEFVLRFIVDGVRHHLALALDRRRVLFESLSAFPKGREQVWYERAWDDEAGSYGWSPGRPTGYQRDANRERLTRDNALYLSTAVALNDARLRPVFLWFKDKLRFLRLDSSFPPLSPGFTVKRMLEDAEDGALIRRLLRHADMGVLSVQARERALTRGDLPGDMPVALAEKVLESRRHMEIALGHRGAGGAEFPLPWEEESSGTHKFFALAGPILDILRNRRIVGLDEIESSMHPVMVSALLKLFFSGEAEGGGAQLVFTTHNPLLLDPELLRRDQIWFADKDDEGATHLYPLSDYKPRNNESLLRGYLSGRYGAIPFLPDGLPDPNTGFSDHGPVSQEGGD